MKRPDLYVRDTELTVATPVDRSIPRAHAAHLITKRKPAVGHHGEVRVRVVSAEEMERLWK